MHFNISTTSLLVPGISALINKNIFLLLNSLSQAKRCLQKGRSLWKWLVRGFLLVSLCSWGPQVHPGLASSFCSWCIGSKSDRVAEPSQELSSPSARVYSLLILRPRSNSDAYAHMPPFPLLHLTSTLWYPKWEKQQQERPVSGFPQNNKNVNWHHHLIIIWEKIVW